MTTNLLSSGTPSLYGLFIALSTVVLLAYAFYYTIVKKYDKNALTYIAPAAILLGFIGARLMYVTVNGNHYQEAANKWKLMDGGYALYGAAAGVIIAAVAVWLVMKRRFSLLHVFDAVCAAAPLAVAVGRMGSVFSEDFFGKRVKSEGLQFFPVAIFKSSDGSYRYALFFYEAVFCILVFFLVRYIDKKVKCCGTSAYLFTVLYCSERAFIEILRETEDGMKVGWVRVNQLISIVVVLAAFVFISIKLCMKTGFKPAYLISYAIFMAALTAAVISVVKFEQNSDTVYKVLIMIFCLVIAATATYSGLLYAIAMKKSPEKSKKTIKAAKKQ